jgi:hypothetical protein
MHNRLRAYWMSWADFLMDRCVVVAQHAKTRRMSEPMRPLMSLRVTLTRMERRDITSASSASSTRRSETSWLTRTCSRAARS